MNDEKDIMRKKLRKMLDVFDCSNRELANKLQVGHPTLNKYFNGYRLPSFRVLRKMKQLAIKENRHFDLNDIV